MVNLVTQTAHTGATLTGIEQIIFTGGSGVDNVTALVGVYNDGFTTGDGNDTVRTRRGVDGADGGLGNMVRLVMDWSTIADPRHGISLSCIGSNRSR